MSVLATCTTYGGVLQGEGLDGVLVVLSRWSRFLYFFLKRVCERLASVRKGTGPAGCGLQRQRSSPFFERKEQ